MLLRDDSDRISIDQQDQAAGSLVSYTDFGRFSIYHTVWVLNWTCSHGTVD